MKNIYFLFSIFYFLFSMEVRAIEGNFTSTKIDNIGTLHIDLTNLNNSIYISKEFPDLELLSYLEVESSCTTISFSSGTFIKSCIVDDDINTIRYSSLSEEFEQINLKKPYKKWDVDYAEKQVVKSYFKFLK